MITSELSEIAPTRCLDRRFLQGLQLLPLDGILQQPLPLGVVLSVRDGAGHDVHILQVHVDVSRKQIGPWDVNFHMTWKGIEIFFYSQILYLMILAVKSPVMYALQMSRCMASLRTNLIEREREREREMFYLMTHSTHFYLRLYGVRHMVKDHSDSEKGNPLPPHRLLLSINSNGSFICTIPQRG